MFRLNFLRKLSKYFKNINQIYKSFININKNIYSKIIQISFLKKILIKFWKKMLNFIFRKIKKIINL